MKQIVTVPGLITDHLLYEKDVEKQTAWITFNRPERLNALADTTHHDIEVLCVDAEDDPNIKVVVFKGAGRCFSSGQDIETLGHRHGIKNPGDRPSSQYERFRREQRWGGPGLPAIPCDWFGFSKKVFVAQVHSYCYGAAFQLMNFCDICIAAENSLFTHPGYRYIGPTLNTGRFLLGIHHKKLKEMTLTVRPLTSWEALQCGLINRVVPLDKLEEEVTKVVESITKSPMDALYLGKVHFQAALDALGMATSETMSWIQHAEVQNMQLQPGEYNILKERLTKGTTGAIRVQQERWAKYDVPPEGALLGYGNFKK